MTLLWLAIGVLLLPAAWLLIVPLRRASRIRREIETFEHKDSSAAQNVSIFQRRLSSLEAARERGDIDHERFEEDRLELERSLLEDTRHTVKRPLKLASSGRLLVPLVLVGVVLAGLLWYQSNGAEGDLMLLQTQRDIQNDPERSLAMYIERMEEQAARQPDNPNVWAELFPIYRETAQRDKAREALTRLIDLEGPDARLYAQMAQLLFFMAGREMTPDVRRWLDRTMELDRREPTALGVLGVHAFDQGNYREAIDRWRRAIANIEDTDTADSLRQGIEVAEQRLGIHADGGPGQSAQAGSESESKAVDQAVDGPAIRVKVSLDDGLRDRVPAQASVFIIARDLAGELAPLAVVRRRVSELPVRVTLSEANAMSSAASLADVNSARLVVRVSPTGQATPQPGDLLGTLDNVEVSRSPEVVHEVVIDRALDAN